MGQKNVLSVISWQGLTIDEKKGQEHKFIRNFDDYPINMKENINREDNK